MPPPALIIPPAEELPVTRLWFRTSVPVKEKLTQVDLNLPYSRTVEMYMSSGMLKLGCRTRAAAVRRITKLGRPDGCPEWKHAGLPHRGRGGPVNHGPGPAG